VTVSAALGKLQSANTNNNLYIKVTQDGILLIEVYIDDIILEVLMTG
jgi:hypothetical protein